MKKLNVIFTGVLLILLSSMTFAQAKTGFEYFKGKWTVIVGAPSGNIEMIVGIEKINDKLTGTMKDSAGKEMYKVVNTTIDEKQVTIMFVVNQGEVAMVLNMKDEDHLYGDINYGMMTVTGVRIKENK